MRDIRKLLFITGVATVTPVIIQARDKLPNIVIFFMDDMGYGDLTITGHFIRPSLFVAVY